MKEIRSWELDVSVSIYMQIISFLLRNIFFIFIGVWRRYDMSYVLPTLTSVMYICKCYTHIHTFLNVDAEIPHLLGNTLYTDNRF